MKNALIVMVFSLLTMSTAASAQSGPPKICHPCLFYGGDLDPSNPNAGAFPNEVTLSDPIGSYTYGAIVVPRGHVLLIEGILFQVVFESYDKLDPQEANWEIRTGDIYDDGGTLVAQGLSRASVQPTGRDFNGGQEYTVAVQVEPPVQISGGNSRSGTEYWFNVLPYCTKMGNGLCKRVHYLASNTVEKLNSLRAFAQPGEEIVLNSAFYGYDWAQCATVGSYSDGQCDYLSFGLMGTVIQ